ncbi:uncharacterized protein LOC131546275 isoform X2 [Onychostoma macrolepis]|uniref:uncharacterized protein LOC131546275 isoform X2 n=1 Tax=Onychostoma macrolepis TaxID=369639 RepID=UPI002729F2B7|nr:uncharacterized protein LOC131546275 isoform X2 [Onychostoma macrolepis]
MKLIFFLLVLLENGMNSTEGLQVTYSTDRVILKYSFHPDYYSYEKACCKFDQSKCQQFVNNGGQVATMYQGRIFITDYNGVFKVIIIGLSVMDAGVYGCGFRGLPATYEYVKITVSESSYKALQQTSRPAVWSTSSPSPPTLSEDDAEKHSDSWRTSYMLAAVLSVLVFAVISMTLIVYRLKTRKKKSTDKSEICGSPNATLEQNGIIYSMVDFKPYQDPSELYANLQIYNPKDTAASSNSTVTVEESVEYSTIMRAPA